MEALDLFSDAPRSVTLPIEGLVALWLFARGFVSAFVSAFSWVCNLLAELAVGRIILARKLSLTGLVWVSFVG